MKKSVAARASGKGGRYAASGTAVRATSTEPKKGRIRSRIDTAIATELAPAAAIAVLEKSQEIKDSLAPALDALGAGVSPATDDSKVRVQLIFEGGEVLPVEMSVQAGEALAEGLSQELKKP